VWKKLNLIQKKIARNWFWWSGTGTVILILDTGTGRKFGFISRKELCSRKLKKEESSEVPARNMLYGFQCCEFESIYFRSLAKAIGLFCHTGTSYVNWTFKKNWDFFPKICVKFFAFWIHCGYWYTVPVPNLFQKDRHLLILFFLQKGIQAFSVRKSVNSYR
jgi:hypothetical protein